MIHDLLRRPRGVGEHLADAVRVGAALSVIVAAIGWSVTDAGIVALCLPATVAPRFVAARPSFDIVTSTTVLVAAWSNVLGLYTGVPGWDLVVHFVCTGVLAALIYVFFLRLNVIAERSRRARVPVVLVPTIGLAISAIWEMIEWLGKSVVSDDIFVTYDDTIGDMVAGGLGALVAGVVVSRVALTRRVTPGEDAQGRAE